MKIVRAAVGAGGGLLDRVFCVVGALLFSQLPEFIQQYLQRLGGHLDEARRVLGQFRHTAAQSGLTLDQFIHQTQANPDPAVAKLATAMTDVVARVDALASAQTAIQNASLWERPLIFLSHIDFSIARATWGIYHPAVPTTFEGVIYALLGVFIALGVYHLGVRYPVNRAIRRRRERRLAAIEAEPAPNPAGE